MKGGERASQQFPGARRQEVEGVIRHRGKRQRLGIRIEQASDVSAELGEQQAHGRDRQDQGEERFPAERPKGHDQQRKEEIKLLLDRKAPGMEQRLQAGIGSEIAGFPMEMDV